MWEVVDFSCLITLLISLISLIVASLTLELIFDTVKEISGRVMFATQFNLPRAPRSNVFSSSFSFEEGPYKLQTTREWIRCMSSDRLRLNHQSGR